MVALLSVCMLFTTMFMDLVRMIRLFLKHSFSSHPNSIQKYHPPPESAPWIKIAFKSKRHERKNIRPLEGMFALEKPYT